jgi:lycopene cyclase domain-containing protein
LKFEYLIFNIIIISAPLLLGMVKKFYFVDKWKIAFISISVFLVPYLIWDSIVTGSHWFFNNRFILGIKLFNIPLEEILFFITVPFACLFTWEMIVRRSEIKRVSFARWINIFSPVLLPISILLYFTGKEYTGLAVFAFYFSILFDWKLGTDLLKDKRFYWFILLTLVFNLVFNGYLTWRPAVMYGESYQLGIRIFTVPVEDFIYGTSLIIFTTSLYQKLKSRELTIKNAAQ